jgi:hypothetical protein
MFSANMGKGVKVDGTASVGHFVTYFDRANQTGEVFAVTAKVLPDNVYALRSTETGAAHSSDLRQPGWTFV